MRADIRPDAFRAGPRPDAALTRPSCRALAVVIVIIGLFLVFAALDSNAHEATGLAGALTIIKRQTYGSALLSAAAFGFLAFGIFGIAEALFRRVDGPGSAFGRPSWGGA